MLTTKPEFQRTWRKGLGGSVRRMGVRLDKMISRRMGAGDVQLTRQPDNISMDFW